MSITFCKINIKYVQDNKQVKIKYKLIKLTGMSKWSDIPPVDEIVATFQPPHRWDLVTGCGAMEVHNHVVIHYQKVQCVQHVPVITVSLSLCVTGQVVTGRLLDKDTSWFKCD